MTTNWEVGDRIQNRWEIHKILRGGMGVVYVVYDHETREAYAAKTFQDEVFARSPLVAERFTQEALAWINLDVHQNVTEARRVENIQGKPYLFLEYVSGGDLSSWIGTPRLAEGMPQLLRFAVQFCDGMMHALSKGIKAHRDIKPHNCLVTDNSVLKVTDFGLARVVTEQEREGGRGGTPEYMPPEQWDNFQLADVRADVYSFGVMLYEMVAGQPPFKRRTKHGLDLEQRHKHDHPPELNSQLAALDEVIQTCLAKTPERRFADFGVVRAQLSEIYVTLTGQVAPQPLTGIELDATQCTNKAGSLEALGRYEEALVCCDRAIGLSPRLAEAWAGKGIVSRSLRRYGEALEYLDRALDLNSRNEQLWSNKGVVLEDLGRPEEALGCYDRALNINPRFAWAWFSKGSTLGKLRRHAEAVACCDRALEINPDFAEVWANKGNDLRQMGRYDEALACFDRALELNPRDELAWSNRALALGKLGRTEEEITCYERALALNPNFAPAWFNKGVVLHQLTRVEEAIACFARVLELDPHHEKALFHQGSLFGELGRHERALDCFDRSIALNPNVENAWMNRGTALLHLARFREAVTCFEEARRLGHPQAMSAIEMCREKLGESGTASKPMLSAAAKEWLEKGVALAETCQWNEALVCYDRALEISPLYALAWLNRGSALGALGRHGEALAGFDRAIELDALFAAAWFNKGVVLERSGRYQEAIACYDRVIEITPRDQGAWFNKGLILMRNLERYREALACFEQAQRLNVPQAATAIALCREMLGR